ASGHSMSWHARSGRDAASTAIPVCTPSSRAPPGSSISGWALLPGRRRSKRGQEGCDVENDRHQIEGRESENHGVVFENATEHRTQNGLSHRPRKIVRLAQKRREGEPGEKERAREEHEGSETAPGQRREAAGSRDREPRSEPRQQQPVERA